MYKIKDIYYILKEVFGPNISIEILDINDRDIVKHVIGDDIYLTIKNEQNLSVEQMGQILNEHINLPNLINQLSPITPEDILTSAFSCPCNTLIAAEGTFSFLRMLKFRYKDIEYVIVIISPMMNHEASRRLFKSFWSSVHSYLNDNNVSIIKEYLNYKVPSELRLSFSTFYDLLLKISVQKIENKNIQSGILLVNDYLEYKAKSDSNLFYDLVGELSLREIERIKQPYLEITDGKECFLVVDNSLQIKGIFFPDKQPLGLDFFNNNGKELTPSIVAKIEGIDTIRVASTNKTIYEIKNGMVRLRDYSIMKMTFTKILDLLSIANYQIELLNNIIEISFIHKGTIIVLGSRIDRMKYSKGIDGHISIIYHRNGENIYRNKLLSQLSRTDGAILVDESLNIYCYGAILKNDLSSNEPININGGSRSYTAKMFSNANPDHLIIKISEDGPIAFYYQGRLEIEV